MGGSFTQKGCQGVHPLRGDKSPLTTFLCEAKCPLMEDFVINYDFIKMVFAEYEI